MTPIYIYKTISKQSVISAYLAADFIYSDIFTRINISKYLKSVPDMCFILGTAEPHKGTDIA